MTKKEKFMNLFNEQSNNEKVKSITVLIENKHMKSHEEINFMKPDFKYKQKIL